MHWYSNQYMRTLFLILGALLIVAVAVWGIRFYLTVQTSKKLIDAAIPFQKTGDTSNAVLVLGDSTAVGIGADTKEESVAGLLSAYTDASSVENYAVSGAVTEDLPEQSEKAQLERYRLILIQIGGNDIIRFRDAPSAKENLRVAIAQLPPSDQVLIISAGDVGGATLFPFFVRPFHTKLNNEYHTAFAELADEIGVTYVNFGNAPSTKMINDRPDIYLAKDGLHPSSAGYALWFKEIQPYL